MSVVNDRGRYYWVKRVPKRFLGLVLGRNGTPVTQVRQALHTDSLAEAKSKAAQIEALRLAEWEAMSSGAFGSAREHYRMAQQLARARGYSYVPLPTLVEQEPMELAKRLLAVSGEKLARREVAQAVLGTVPAAFPSLLELRDEYFELTSTRHTKKTPAQLRRWRLPRERAVRNFLGVIAPRDARGNPVPPEVDKITREDALAFRKWWTDRVSDGMSVASANKDFSHLSEMWNTWTDLKQVELGNPFAKLRFQVKGRNKTTTPAFSRKWVVERILVDGALGGLNEEARDVFLMTINTGLRPSEITDAPLEDFEVRHEVPHIRVRENGREIKVAHTERDIPLTGVSLAAALRIVERGGILRYRHKANSWSAVVNKYLTNNGLRETPKHVAYSMRHYVEDALLAADVSDRVRADILGHEYKRPSYGTGGALAGRLKALQLIAL